MNPTDNAPLYHPPRGSTAMMQCTPSEGDFSTMHITAPGWEGDCFWLPIKLAHGPTPYAYLQFTRKTGDVFCLTDISTMRGMPEVGGMLEAAKEQLTTSLETMFLSWTKHQVQRPAQKTPSD